LRVSRSDRKHKIVLMMSKLKNLKSADRLILGVI